MISAIYKLKKNILHTQDLGEKTKHGNKRELVLMLK
jgi:hypothetical protein